MARWKARIRSSALAPSVQNPPRSALQSSDPGKLDPLQVISEREAAFLLNVSVDTLRRRVRAGDGPPRIALSDRRVGYRRGALAEWLDRRVSGQQAV
jgi:predicted DNA-binding transcriptional regulator AlpA